MMGMPGLPPLYQESPTRQQELQLARDALEHAILLSIKLGDEDAFERNFLQLQTYYMDTKAVMPPSEQQLPILGLRLLRLLVQNRLAEFHTELETLAPESQENVYIKHVINLEQCLMEGAYKKLLEHSKDNPSDLYSHFTEQLIDTVREDIADCCEKSYQSLALKDAVALLMLKTQKQVKEHAEDRGWEVRDGRVHFQTAELSKQMLDEQNSFEAIRHTLLYARELERIV